MAEGQQPFQYTEGGLGALGYALSDSRLSTYLKAGNRDKERAMELYLWNARLSKAMRFPLEIAEVTVRNRIHYALTDRWGADWPRDADFRNTAASKSIEAIEEVYALLGTGRRAPDIVGGLSFGFWAAILKSRFVETLWRNRLDRFFPHLPQEPLEKKLEVLIDRMETARTVRNRIGHLEPIFKADPSATHSQVLQLIGYACRQTAGWARHHSTFQRVLREGAAGAVRPGPVFQKANRAPFFIDATTAVDKALTTFDGKTTYLVVGDAGAWHVIDHTQVGTWTSGHSAAGIVDLTEWTVADVVNGVPTVPLVSRSTAVAELLVALGVKSGGKGRYAVVTENGKVGDKMLGVVDLLDFIG